MLGGNRDLVCANDTWAVAEDRRGWSRLKSASASAGDTTRNMIHNDLKPRSFLLDSNLELKIADFSGSTKNGSRASASESTRFFLNSRLVPPAHRQN